MSMSDVKAEVVAVFPNKVKIVVDDLENFRIAEESLRVGSYLKIADNENAVLVAIIENFQIQARDDGSQDYVIEAFPLGVLRDQKFERGGDALAIPPKTVQPATIDDIRLIYGSSLSVKDRFCFSKLATNKEVEVPVDG
ncbi:MAG: Bipolar DNA helicase, partial [Alphaproteobacteria bacterium]